MRTLLLIGLLCSIGGTVRAQARVPARAGTAAMDCRACHTSATPTKNSPALAACPRLKITGYHAVDEAPPTLTLGRDGATYGAVIFAHRAHAHMAETGKGCNGCHHYDQARPIQKCKNCHAVSRQREDLGKPDLKAAMHRQCLDCHREWNPAGSCATCHVKAGSAAAKGAVAPVAGASVAGAPVAGASAAGAPVAAPRKATVVAPQRVVYETGAKEGKTVTFFHADHTGRFALACAACHQNESCRGCHDRKLLSGDRTVLARQTAKGLTDEQAHVRCAACHAKDECSTCHKGMSTKTIGFDHGRRTGFALNRFHAPLTCKQCHTAPGAFGRINASCESCHKGWQAKFAHARTGLTLDEQHKDVECAGCHEDKTFRDRPVCGSCHTDKTWPAQKPGTAAGRPAVKR